MRLRVYGRLLKAVTWRGERRRHLCGVLASGIGRLPLVVGGAETVQEALEAWGVVHSRSGMAQVLVEPLKVLMDLLQCLLVFHQTSMVQLAPLQPFLGFEGIFRAFNTQLVERAA